MSAFLFHYITTSKLNYLLNLLFAKLIGLDKEKVAKTCQVVDNFATEINAGKKNSTLSSTEQNTAEG